MLESKSTTKVIYEGSIKAYYTDALALFLSIRLFSQFDPKKVINRIQI